MKPGSRAQVEIRDVTAGLWVWRLEHPQWKPDQGWEPLVTSTCVESGGEVLVLDPLAPPDDAIEVWARLDARRTERGSGAPTVTSHASTIPGSQSPR